jgi:asparagine synthase (glutamine-hydrolysing)
MNQAIAHRGPDDHGEELCDRQVALANRRLAIIDLTPAGHMPMTNRKQTAWITYNGEIYNFQTLRQDLEQKGYRFSSQSDTEVILNLYDAYGPACFAKLEGMFALALWDRKRQQLVLARDHFGIKPLHYCHINGWLIFGSEIKAILAHPQVKKSLNLKALSQYFSVGFGAIPSPNTIFQDIFKLPPAHYAVWKKGTLTLHRYWDVAQVKPSDVSFREAKGTLLDLLSDSVRRQLVSDVPLGGFLSGGVDSSTIVALMKQHHTETVKTFSIGFNAPDFDESKYAKKVARQLDTDHHHKTFQTRELLEILPQVIAKLDEPLADGSLLPTFLLSQFTRGSVTVALSGDGGDELFAGYPTYFAHHAAKLLKIIPSSIRRSLLDPAVAISRFIPLMKHSPNLSSRYKIKRFLLGTNRDLAKQYLNFMGPARLDEKARLWGQIVRAELDTDPAVAYLAKLKKEVAHFDLQKQLQYLDLMVYLEEDCLVKTDRASSFNSLEVRVPFLTPQIAEFAFSLPSSYHLSGFTLKRLFKAAVKDLIPQEIINRPKKGFGIPVHQWLRTDLKSQLAKLLAPKRLRNQGLFDADYVQTLIGEHQNQKEDHRMILWALLVFQLWYDQWFR